MICDIMTTISEDGDTMGDGNMEDNNFEQLMVNMLDERDKLMETLRETQESLSTTKNCLKEAELERDTLLRQFDLLLGQADLDREGLIRKLASYDLKSSREDDDLLSPVTRLKQQKWTLAEEFVTMAKEIFQMQEKLNERNEEIFELKSERANTKLLLEHLESLVSRHERSLRMTVVKRQTQTSAGVSSEVEVLKALKSLFEHHKALDEKVRERLRTAVEKANALEEDFAAATQEIDRLQEELKACRAGRHNGDALASIAGKIQNGPVNQVNDDLQVEINELKYRYDQKQRELDKTFRELKELRDRNRALEEQVSQTSKHVSTTYDSSQKLQHDLDEVLAQKADMENRIITLEKRFVRSQNELSGAREELERMRAEYGSMQTLIEQKEEKILNWREQFEFAEQKLSQHLANAAELPKIQEELESRKAALNAAEERNFTAEERLHNLQAQLEDTFAELNRAKEREKLWDAQNKRLQETVDKLLNESDERLQVHLQEKMATIEEKTSISQELEKTRISAEELQREKNSLLQELDKLRVEVESYRTDRTSETDSGLLRHQPAAYVLSPQPTSQERRSELPALRGAAVTPAGSKSGSVNVKSANEQSWQKMSHATVLTNVTKALLRTDVMDIAEKAVPSGLERGLLAASFGGVDPLESLPSNDAQRLANVLQQQLDAINEELALLQAEHRTTEQLAEQIEKRVGSETNSVDSGSLSSSRGSGGDVLDEKKIRRFSGDAFLRGGKGDRETREPPESNSSFLFTSYDPLDTKPLMLKSGRSQEQLERVEMDENPDTPGSLPSGSTESDSLDRSKNFDRPWNLNTTYDSDREPALYDFASNPSSITSSMESLTRRGAKSRSLKTSLGKIFSGKGKMKGRDSSGTRGEDSDSNAEAQRDAELRMKQKLLEDAFSSGASFSAWNAPTILAWLELWVKLPEWYIQACRANVKSGSIMSALSDYEIQHEIGVNNPLHRLKLRIAIHEMVNVTSPMAPPTAKTALVVGDMNHFWIASEWLPSLGLSQYRYPFIENLVDARMLEHITKKEFAKYLKVVDGFHRTSISCGTKCLEMLNYDRKLLEKRRRDSEEEDKDVLVWSNARVIKWASAIGLDEFADCLRQSGVHGAVMALDETFDVNAFAYQLQIPSTNEKARVILEREYKRLLAHWREHTGPREQSAVVQADVVQPDLADGEFKRSKSWRKKFKKDKPQKDRAREIIQLETTRWDSGESDGSQKSGSSSSEAQSPSRRPRKSPAIDRKHYAVRTIPS